MFSINIPTRAFFFFLKTFTVFFQKVSKLDVQHQVASSSSVALLQIASSDFWLLIECNEIPVL